MADNKLGEDLYNAGCRQGALLPPLPWSVIYRSDDPLSKIARTAKRQAGQGNTLAAVDLPLQGIGIASGITRREDYLVIASQDCDLIRNVSEEPNIMAMRAFITDNSSILRYADSNSSRYFLLDRKRGLVAESSLMVLIEKPVLLNFTPESGACDSATQERFARWIAHHFDRSAFDDDVVGAIIKPILEHLSQMQKDTDPDLDALDNVKELRIAKIVGKPPFDVRLLFIIPEDGLPDNGIALAHLVSRMRTWFNPLAARLVAWDARHLREISVGDYLETQQIYLEQYTYRGQIIRGLIPSANV
ncbi:MAG: hypothetical protein NVS4B9_40210 [Ktedonobacteraceae bacterium]